MLHEAIFINGVLFSESETKHQNVFSISFIYLFIF